MSASRGAVLIGLAVVAGLLIFATIDDNGGTTATRPVETATTVQTTPATNLDGTPVTTVAGTTDTTKAKGSNSKNSAARPPDQVLVQVLNGSGIANAATNRSNDLKAKGYQLLSAANAPERTGTSVQCKSGYDKEADALVTALGELGVTATVGTLPDPLPSDYDALANCYVILGK
jgi:hypothetical protein